MAWNRVYSYICVWATKNAFDFYKLTNFDRWAATIKYLRILYNCRVGIGSDYGVKRRNEWRWWLHTWNLERVQAINSNSSMTVNFRRLSITIEDESVHSYPSSSFFERCHLHNIYYKCIIIRYTRVAVSMKRANIIRWNENQRFWVLETRML